MQFNELLTYLILTETINKKMFMDVTPFGVQYRVHVSNDRITGYIFYRELHSNSIMVKNTLLVNNKIERNFSSDELIDILEQANEPR